jgi:hypothetical protein
MCHGMYCVVALTSPNPCKHLNIYQILYLEEVHIFRSHLGVDRSTIE